LTWRLLTIGKPSLAFARDGVEEYAARIRHYTALQIQHGRERGAEENSRQLLQLARGASRIVALDERGDDLSTETLVDQIDRWELDGSVKSVAILMGGADGHAESVRTRADRVWRLSALTLQHELAQVVFLKALYRAYTIKRGEPYHR